MLAKQPSWILIDCDPGVDDAFAISLAARAPELKLRAITTVCGNATLEKVTDNALSIAAALGLKCPVYAGAEMPMRVKPHYATDIWGGDGRLDLKRPRRGALTQSADDFLEEHLEEAEQASITACLIAPLTNLAKLLVRRPDLASKFSRIIIMGGALGAGNATRAAELNIWFDPHAARIVLQSAIPAIILPLDITNHLVLSPDQRARLDGSDHPAASMCSRLLGDADTTDHHPIHDAAAIAYLLWPELYQLQRGTLSISATMGPARGQTCFSPGQGNHWLITGLERQPLLDKIIWRLTAKAPRTR